MMFNTLPVALVALSACLVYKPVPCQQVFITGLIPGGESMELRMMVNSDFISYRQDLLLRTVIDANGKFEFAAEIPNTTLITLETGHYTFSFFAEREGHYELYCDSITTLNEYRPFYNKEIMPATIAAEPPPGLNVLAGRFNMEYNDFILREFSGVYQRKNTNIINAFKEQAEKKYGPYDHPFLNQYIEYKLAGVELAMANSKKPELFRAHLHNQPVLLNHPEYMNFFNNFFNQYLYPDNRFVPRADLYSTINIKPDLDALLDSLGKDTTLRNEVVRELVCIKTLKQLYSSKDFLKANVLALLKEMNRSSKFDDHRTIAANLVEELTHLEKYSTAPPFELQGLDGNLIRLSDFRGKPVYINFFVSWSSGCLAELGLMKDLQAKYENKIEFLSISMDNSMEIVRELKNEKGYTWHFGFNGSDFDLISQYRIKTFPVFILLDGDGRVYEYPAFKPSEIIRESFDRLLNLIE